MGRKSSIERKPEAVRKRIERFLRENRLTLDEMIAALQTEFGPEAAPKRSALHRYKTNFEEMMGRMREIDTAARVMVEELGESTNDKAGQLMAHAITTLATNAALNAHGEDTLNVKEIGQLARAARNAIEVKKISRGEAQAIRKEAQEALQREQSEKLKAITKQGGLSEETAEMFRKQILGIA